MNKKFIATIVALILTFEGFSQILIGNASSVNKPLSLNESVNDISFTQEFSYLKAEKMTIKGREFYHLDMGKDFVPSYKIGQAELPVYTSLIEVPFCENITIEEKVLEKKVIKLKDNILVAPKQVSQSKQNEDIGFSIDEKYYNRDGFGTGNRVTVEEVGIMGGSKMARLTISPIRYNPKTNEIEVATKIQVSVHFVGANYAKTLELKNKMGRCFNDFTQGKVINKNLSATVNSTNIMRPYKMVIVSNSMFQSTLQPFIKWKKQEGFNVIEAYTSQTNVGTTTTSIKAYLKSLYDSASADNPAPDYILIVGDTDKVPTFTGSYPGSGETQYTDLYYAEYTNDMLPEAFYGRMSAETTTQLTNILNKTITYEKYQMSDDSYLNRILLIAGKEVNEPAPTVGNGQVNYAKQYFSGLDTTVYYNPSCGTTANQAQVKQDINEGQGWINYSAHCDQTGWYIPSYLVSDVSAMTNTNKYGIFINNCCLSGKYDVSECFTESLLRAPNKGAIGAIGGSNYTYWYEDYYWAVGSKATSVNPSYDANNLGMYDRFFHTHGEAKSNQYTTMGQMIPAGNLAVVAMNSSLINYYWEIYNLQGDPSLMPYVGQGLTFNTSIPDELPIGSQTLTLTTVPYTYVALSKGDSLINAMEADSNGNISMDISGITEVGTFNIVLTHQFYKPLIDSILFIASNAPYISLNDIEFVNSQTNEVASKLEENTSYYMNIKVANLGNQPLSFSSNALTLENNNKININNNTVSSITTIGANSTVQLNNCFNFTTNGGLLNNSSIAFVVDILGNNYSRQQTINKIVAAPDLDINSLGVSINNDTITLSFKVENVGDKATSNPSTVTISDINNVATIIGNNTNSVNSLVKNESANESFTLLKASNNDDMLSFKLRYVAGNYQITKAYSIAVDGQIETFESHSFTAFAWTNNSNHPWTIDSTNKHNGSYSARSAVISDSQVSDLSINVNCLSQDTISFYVKVSSEENYDILHFYIDGVEQLSLSGTVGWTKKSFVVGSGQHTFLWEYAKDYSQSAGSDCAWIDDVKLPMSGTVSGLNDIDVKNVSMYPNPAKNDIQLNNLKDNSKIMIIDVMGRVRYNNKTNSSSCNLNLNLEQGMYYVVIKDNNEKVYSTQKLIINK
jgi:hypothetical protein